MNSVLQILLKPAVIVAALGYFVDIYDLLLFNMVRVESLRDLGYAGRELEVGAILHNIQVAGLLLGGVLWGVLADKKGRLSVLFASIFLYSVANFLNAYVSTFTEYAFLRFFGGLGLAGELGAGITLVAEILPKHQRGIGTMLVASIGVMGAVVGGWVAQICPWRTAYLIGGILGFGLLLLRIGVVESGLFEHTKSSGHERGDFFSLFTRQDRFRRFSNCVVAGLPIWFNIGILIAYAPEFAHELGVIGPVTTAKAVMIQYAGFVVGDLGSGVFSQWIKSRNKAVKIFLILNAVSVLLYLGATPGKSVDWFYAFCFCLGFTGGYWAVIITMAAEQFGTNLRGTVATSVPNFIRGGLIPMSALFLALKPVFGLVSAAYIVSGLITVAALFALKFLGETFGKDLNHLET